MKKIKAGIIGFGRMAEGHHLEKMNESGLYDVVGVCDITESRRQKAEELELKATDSLEEFLGWDTELVVIATHSSQHHADVLATAAAGKHMLVEKPLSVNAREAEEMAAAASANNVIMTAYHNRHFNEDYNMVKSAVAEGLLGEMVFIENRTFGARPATGFGVPDYNQQWRVTAAAGGGTLLDFGPHWCEQILDLMAGHKVVQVFGDVRHFKWGDVDDYFRIEMVFDNGTRAIASKADISFMTLPFKWLILGTQATLHGPVDGKVIVTGEECEIHRSRQVETLNIHENVAKHIREGEDLIITPDHSLRVMQVLQAGVDSSEAGKSVDVSI